MILPRNSLRFVRYANILATNGDHFVSSVALFMNSLNFVFVSSGGDVCERLLQFLNFE